MNEAEEVAPPRTRRGMLAFYVGIGAVLALFVGGWFAWTPLRIWYWEQKASSADTGGSNFIPLGLAGWPVSPGNPCTDAVSSLVAVGPQSLPAIRRLLHGTDQKRTLCVLAALRDPKSVWALPVLVELVRDDRDATARYWAMRAAAGASGNAFPIFLSGMGSEEEDHQRLLRWWEREGKAKYGGAQ